MTSKCPKLYEAIKCMNFEAVQDMVQNGANVNQFDESHLTSLHLAANVGATEILQFLLWRGADPDITTNHGWTACHIAAIRGHVDCLRVMIDHNANISSFDNNGQTPGHLAASHGNKLFLEIFLNSDADISAVDKRGWTMLHCAAFHGRLGCTELLIRRGMNVDQADKNGNTPAHLAAKEGQLTVLQLLVSCARTPLYMLDAPNDDGDTPETLARRFRKNDVINYIASVRSHERQYPLDARELRQFQFPAHVAVYDGELTRLKALLENGVVGFDEVDDEGSTLLHIAASTGHLRIIRWLLENGADVSKLNRLNETPIEVAERCEQRETVKLLNQTNATMSTENPWLSGVLPLEAEQIRPARLSAQQCKEAQDRALERIETLQRLLNLSKADYNTLVGPQNWLLKNEDLKMQEQNRELEKCQVQLEYEKMRRMRVEAELDEAKEEIKRLNSELSRTTSENVPTEDSTDSASSNKMGRRSISKRSKSKSAPVLVSAKTNQMFSLNVTDA